jgi:tRNA A22 N-methylase
MNRFIPQMNKEQEEILKERNKYYELLELDPSTLVVSIGTEQFVVGEYCEYSTSFDNAEDFIRWRLKKLKSLDKLAHEMGYSSDELLDFMEDLLEYGSEENLEQLLIDRYDAENMETWINGKK